MNIFPLTLIPNDTRIDFMRWRFVTIVFMAVLMVASVAMIATKGFNYALDFTGGTSVELLFEKPADVDAVMANLTAQRVAQALDARLRSRVRPQPRRACDRRRGRVEQHVPAPFQHVRQARPHGPERADEVDVGLHGEDPLSEHFGRHPARCRKPGRAERDKRVDWAFELREGERGSR